MAESFFVDSQGSVTTSPSPTPPQLGHYRRSCSACDREWHLGQAACPCGSHELTERYIEGTLLERVGDAIKAVTAPVRPKPPRASAAQVARLRAVQAAVVALLEDLRSLDGELIAAVRADVLELIPAQGHINQALSITGDRSVQRIPGLSLGLESLADFLGSAIHNLEDPK
jgi:hypothetical protein